MLPSEDPKKQACSHWHSAQVCRYAISYSLSWWTIYSNWPVGWTDLCLVYSLIAHELFLCLNCSSWVRSSQRLLHFHSSLSSISTAPSKTPIGISDFPGASHPSSLSTPSSLQASLISQFWKTPYHSQNSPLSAVLILELIPSQLSTQSLQSLSFCWWNHYMSSMKIIFHQDLFSESLQEYWSTAFAACLTLLGCQRIIQWSCRRHVSVVWETPRLLRSASGSSCWCAGFEIQIWYQ